MEDWSWEGVTGRREKGEGGSVRNTESLSKYVEEKAVDQKRQT